MSDSSANGAEIKPTTKVALDNVGQGVNRSREPKPRKEPRSPAGMSARDAAVLLDGPEEWSDTPSLRGQMAMGNEYWKVDRQETRIFDLQNPEQLKEYDALISKVYQPDANINIANHDVKSFDAIAGWKVMVVVQHVKFRKLLLKKDLQ